MADMVLELDEDENQNALNCVRPVGPWRFLTPLEHIEEGDLFRVVTTSQQDNNPYDDNWSPVTNDAVCVGERYLDNPHFEVIRRVDSTAFTTPLFRRARR